MRRVEEDNDEWVEVPFDNLLAQTPKAFLIEFDGDEYWVAKSQVDNTEALEEEMSKPPQERGETDVIIVPRWVARQNGWLDDEE
jgi:hypothetical protein